MDEKIKLNDGFASFMSSVSNSASGVGTSRDPSSYNQINTANILSYQECQSLYRNSKIIENIICKVPNASIDSIIGFDISGSANDTNFTREFLLWLEELDFLNKLKETCYLSRLLGDGYLLLDINDGKKYDEKLFIDNIKSLDFCLPKGQDECFPVDNWLYPEKYNINYYNQEKTQQLTYHKSRIIHLTGKKLFGQMLRENGGRNDSILNQVFQAYAKWETAQTDVKNLLASHSLITFAVKGLSRLVATCEGKSSLWNRFETMMMAMNVMKGVPYDADSEKVEFINRSFTGVKEGYEVLTEALLATTDLPSYIVFGSTNGTAFSESGLSERMAFDQQVQNYNKHVILPALKQLIGIAQKCKNSPAYNQKYITPIFGSTIVLTDLEQATLAKELAASDTAYISSGVLDAQTVKNSRFAQTGKIGLFIQT